MTVWARHTASGSITLYSTREKAIWRGGKPDASKRVETFYNRDGMEVTEIRTERTSDFVASIIEMEVL